MHIHVYAYTLLIYEYGHEDNQKSARQPLQQGSISVCLVRLWELEYIFLLIPMRFNQTGVRSFSKLLVCPNWPFYITEYLGFMGQRCTSLVPLA